MEDWDIYKKMQSLKNISLPSHELAYKELNFLRYFSTELKFYIIRIFNKLFITAIIIIIGFGIMHCYVARIYPSNLQAYDTIQNDSCILMFLYYSIVIFTTVGFGDLCPKYNHITYYNLAHVVTIIETIFTLIFSMLGLTILVASIFTILSLRPPHISAYLRYINHSNNNKLHYRRSLIGRRKKIRRKNRGSL
jgi:hypothetical protein